MLQRYLLAAALSAVLLTVRGQADGTFCSRGFPSRSTLENFANRPDPTVEDDRQYIFTGIRFTPGCSGSITKWKFVATGWDSNEILNPELQIWRLSTGVDYTKVNSSTIRIQQSTSDTQLYVYDVDPPLSFLPGDVFGVYVPPSMRSHLQLLFSQQLDSPVSYYVNKPSMAQLNTISLSSAMEDVSIPLVNVEVLADDPVNAGNCTVGFVTDEDLRVSIATAIHNVQFVIPGLNFSCGGIITEWFLGAVEAGNANRNLYPELQLWRASDISNSTYIKVNNTFLEGTSMLTNLFTGLVNPPIRFQSGDFIGLFLPDASMGNADGRLRVYFLQDFGPVNFEYFDTSENTVNLLGSSMTVSQLPLISLVIETFSAAPTSTIDHSSLATLLFSTTSQIVLSQSPLLSSIIPSVSLPQSSTAITLERSTTRATLTSLIDTTSSASETSGTISSPLSIQSSSSILPAVTMSTPLTSFEQTSARSMVELTTFSVSNSSSLSASTGVLSSSVVTSIFTSILGSTDTLISSSASITLSQMSLSSLEISSSSTVVPNSTTPNVVSTSSSRVLLESTIVATTSDSQPMSNSTTESVSSPMSQTTSDQLPVSSSSQSLNVMVTIPGSSNPSVSSPMTQTTSDELPVSSSSQSLNVIVTVPSGSSSSVSSPMTQTTSDELPVSSSSQSLNVMVTIPGGSSSSVSSPMTQTASDQLPVSSFRTSSQSLNLIVTLPTVPSGSSSSGVTTGLAVGVFLSLVIFVIVLLVITLLLCRRRRRRYKFPTGIAANVLVNPTYSTAEGLSLGDGGEPTKADLSEFLGDYAEPDQDMTLTRNFDEFDNPLYSEPDKASTMEESRFDNSIYSLPSPTNNQNIDWGVYVPTQSQRENPVIPQDSLQEIPSDGIYNTLSATMSEISSSTFFEETDIFWTPSSEPNELYDQLALHKYREILIKQIQVSHCIGTGQFGVVQKGVWNSPDGQVEVAIKTLNKESTEIDRVKFLQEAAINGQFHHRAIITLHGVVTLGQKAMIVLELMKGGDLKDYLPNLRPKEGEGAPRDVVLQCLDFCFQVASGMKYLSAKLFVHRDLAARNILVSDDGKQCKISDFGMARDIHDSDYYMSQGGKIPVKWTAPEALNYKKYSTASDVWSYGALMYEIWSLGYKPFGNEKNMEVIRMVMSGSRLPPPPGCPRAIYQQMISCWHPESKSRPTFEHLVIFFSQAQSILLHWKEGDSSVHPQASMLGAPLEAGKALYPELQNTYKYL